MERIDYEKQAQDFLDRFELTLKAVFKDDRCPPWECEREHLHGDRYRVTIKRIGPDRVFTCGEPGSRSVSFDFWNSLNDMQAGKRPTAYGVLACISGNTHCADTFKDFCFDFGYEQDFRKAEQTYKLCRKIADKLGAFFAEEEMEALREIQ